MKSCYCLPICLHFSSYQPRGFAQCAGRNIGPRRCGDSRSTGSGRGPRWQMVPAYALTGLFFLVSSSLMDEIRKQSFYLPNLKPLRSAWVSDPAETQSELTSVGSIEKLVRLSGRYRKTIKSNPPSCRGRVSFCSECPFGCAIRFFTAGSLGRWGRNGEVTRRRLLRKRRALRGFAGWRLLARF